MTVLPVVDRELRVASRRAWTYWGRAGAGLSAILISAWFLVLQASTGLGQMGKPLFSTLSFLSFLFSALAGVTYSADSVSAEKREGTLGLLFLTDLHGFDVTLGKLTASSLGAFYSLLATLPVLALALMLGGVTAGEYWRMVLVLLNTLLLSLAAGMLASVWSTDSKRAALAAFLLIVAALFLLLVLGWLAGIGLRHFDYSKTPLGEWNDLWVKWVSWMTPISGYIRTFDDEYKIHAEHFWLSQGYTFGLAIVFLILASCRLPHSWQDGTQEPRQRGWRSRLERLRFPTAARRSAFRTRLLELGPLVWLTGRHWLRPLLVWAFLVGSVVLCFLVSRLLGASGNPDEAGTCFIISILCHFVLKVWIASEAPRQFIEDRRSGAMELLLATPLTVGEVLRGRLVALHRQFGGPIVAVLMGDALLLTWTFRQITTDTDENYWLGFLLLRMAFLPFDGYTLAWVGLWKGMTARSGRATAMTVTRVLTLPWIIYLALLTLLAFMSIKSSSKTSTQSLTQTLMLGGWAVISIGNNVFWLLRVRDRLKTEFRELATHRPDQKRAWFRRKPRTTAP
jgi:ABC-type Na+ efflux pump permease subunit